MDYEKAVQKYVALRAELESVKQAHREVEAEYRRKMELLEQWITEQADEHGLKTIATTAGTAYWSTLTNCSVAAPSEFTDFVLENEAWDLMEKRASKKAVKAYVEENGEPPPGVNFSTYRSFNVRSS